MNNSTLDARTDLTSTAAGNSPTTKGAYIMIVILAFTGNFFVISLFSRKRNLLKKTYNVFFLTLAVTDLTISINLLLVPSFIYGDLFPYPSGHLAGEIVCRVLWSRWLLFTFGTASVYLCLLLTIERWFAVVTPLRYQASFGKKRVIGSLVSVFCVAFFFGSSAPFEVIYLPWKNPSQRCAWKRIWGKAAGVVGVLQFLGKIFVPSLLMVAMFLHMKLRYSPIHEVPERRESRVTRTTQTRRTITKMVGVASGLMITCWMPNTFFVTLSMFDLVTLDSSTHHYLVFLAILNSVINPAIYGITNKTYRKGYWEVLLSFCPPPLRRKLARSRGEVEDRYGNVAYLVRAIHRRRPSFDWRRAPVSPANLSVTNIIAAAQQT